MSYYSIPEMQEIGTLQQLLASLNEKVADMGALEDFRERMTVKDAANSIDVKTTVINRAIERGEIDYVVLPGSARKAVTPCALRNWIQEYCIHRKSYVPT